MFVVAECCGAGGAHREVECCGAGGRGCVGNYCILAIIAGKGGGHKATSYPETKASGMGGVGHATGAL